MFKVSLPAGETHPTVGGGKHINGGKGSNEVFLKSGDGTYCSIDPMVVRGDELDVDCFLPDGFLNCGRTLIVHCSVPDGSPLISVWRLLL
jgi:hypothetical protein